MITEFQGLAQFNSLCVGVAGGMHREDEEALKIAKRMFENVLGESRRDLCEAISPKLSTFIDLLRQRGLIISNVIQEGEFDARVDAILEEYKGAITSLNEVSQLQVHCKVLLDVLEKLGERAIEVSRDLREKWEKKIREKANIDFELSATRCLNPRPNHNVCVPSIPPQIQGHFRLNLPDDKLILKSAKTLPSWGDSKQQDNLSATVNNNTHQSEPPISFSIPHDAPSQAAQADDIHPEPQPCTSQNETIPVSDDSQHLPNNEGQRQEEEEVEGHHVDHLHHSNDNSVGDTLRRRVNKSEESKQNGRESREEHIFDKYCKLVQEDHAKLLNFVICIVILAFVFCLIFTAMMKI